MSLNKIFRIFGYFVSAVLVVFGIVLITGIPLYAGLYNIPDRSKIMFGVVFILYGVYRAVRLLFLSEKQDE